MVKAIMVVVKLVVVVEPEEGVMALVFPDWVEEAEMVLVRTAQVGAEARTAAVVAAARWAPEGMAVAAVTGEVAASEELAGMAEVWGPCKAVG